MSDDSPLGRETDYPERYDPGLLHAIPRSRGRPGLSPGEPLPFYGVDIWNAWELGWLDDRGRPHVARAEIRFPVDSTNLVESKSLKLYLGSFAMEPVESPEAVAGTIRRDLGECVGAPVRLELDMNGGNAARPFRPMPGVSLDEAEIECDRYLPDADLLSTRDGPPVEEQLHSELLRSLCPVTSQPDTAGVLITYAGAPIDHAGLLQYIVSFRRHRDFHEACVERMFGDIRRQCRPERLSVYARYQRRGGIDINPYRSTEPGEPENLRLWRQ